MSALDVQVLVLEFYPRLKYYVCVFVLKGILVVVLVTASISFSCSLNILPSVCLMCKTSTVKISVPMSCVLCSC